MLEALGLPGPQELLLFMSAVFVLNATPGVDFLLTVSRTLKAGARAGTAAALGISAGCVVHALAAAFGLAALAAASCHRDGDAGPAGRLRRWQANRAVAA